jgi:hypothetical protein
MSPNMTRFPSSISILLARLSQQPGATACLCYVYHAPKARALSYPIHPDVRRLFTRPARANRHACEMHKSQNNDKL